MRCSAWLLSQDCDTKTASRPNITANAIMTIVLVRTRLPSFDAAISCGLLVVNIEGRWYRIDEIARANPPMLKIG
jgi:hypothetical protein